MNWLPNSWRSKPIKQFPLYQDMLALQSVESRLSLAPPLIYFHEIMQLRKKLTKVAHEEEFLLQGGDCVESFQDDGVHHLYQLFQLFLQMSAILSLDSQKPILKIGRIAGQFAKPRSSLVEVLNGIALPVYRGDMVNGIDFNDRARIPDPLRQERAYQESAARLDVLRNFMESECINLAHLSAWMLDLVGNKLNKYPETSLTKKIIAMLSAIDNMQELGLSFLIKKDFFISHEALLLGYEEALTRRDDVSQTWYATSAHMLWIGNRTRQIDHAHVEYCRGIVNPIGIKCSASIDPHNLLRLLDILNPLNEEGKILLITRFGSHSIAEHLPLLIRAVSQAGKRVVWSCDPMHGNTQIESGRKTRLFENIIQEVENFFAIHDSEGSVPGGLHLEMTGNNVTECLGGPLSITPECLQDRYNTFCDPRLNPTQSIELAFIVGDLLKKRNNKHLEDRV